MPRTARLDAPGVLHHVMIRGIERRKIFRNDKDREDFIERLGVLCPETGTGCYAWAFMSNHARFLFRTGVEPLSRLMKRLLTGYVLDLTGDIAVTVNCFRTGTNLLCVRKRPTCEGRWGHILICELSRAKVSCITAWEKQERWRDVGGPDMRGHITEWRRFWSRPVPGSHNESICLALTIRQSVIS
jgi:hypothetical protein